MLKHIGTQLRTQRTKLGLTVEQCADVCGMAKSEISNIENGKRNVTIKTLAHVCMSMDLKFDVTIN